MSPKRLQQKAAVMTLVLKKKNWIFVPALLTLLSSSVSPASAQDQLNRGFEYRIMASTSGEELARQPNLWTFNVEFKPLRMISVDVTDPVTGKKEPTRITYLVYRAWNPGVEQKKRENVPVNKLDPPRGKDMFMPEFTLVTSDNDRQEVYVDEIIPEAQAAIIKRERHRLFNSIELIQPVPEAAPKGERPENMIYGVAIWRNVDPEADLFTVYMTGFTNAYVAAEGPEGNMLMLRKTVRQRYWRPGDELDLFEKEIRTEGEAAWLYRAEDGTIAPPAEMPVEVPADQEETPADPQDNAGDEESDSAEGADEEPEGEPQ